MPLNTDDFSNAGTERPAPFANHSYIAKFELFCAQQLVSQSKMSVHEQVALKPIEPTKRVAVCVMCLKPQLYRMKAFAHRYG